VLKMLRPPEVETLWTAATRLLCLFGGFSPQDDPCALHKHGNTSGLLNGPPRRVNLEKRGGREEEKQRRGERGERMAKKVREK
jgi:hypothetical protein